MELFLSTFNMTVPIFIVVFVGYVLKRFNMVPESLAGPLNTLAFNVLYPCLCIKQLQTTNMSMEYLWMGLYAIITFLISIPILCRIVPKFIPERAKAGVVVQGSFRSNSILFAMSLMISVCGEENAGPIMVMVAVATLLFNSMAVIVLSHFSETGAGADVSPVKTIVKIFKNPLIVGTLVGIILRVLPIEIPNFIMTPINNLATSGTPVAMLAIGLSFDFKSISKNLKAIGIATMNKLVIMPLVWTVVGYLIGFRSYILFAIFIEHACPGASAGVPMADAMGCDGKLAGEILLVQTLCASVTIFIGVYIIRFLGII
ncbi:MAG: AEC family transporter [Oscillospiraceae bacterium]|nr:AEC family transporter [Oscillospiraceae bacterium]